MKKWTQAEYDEIKGSLSGFIELGSGDFRAVNFKHRCRVEIGENSILGDDVDLGEFTKIGAHTEVGDRCRLGAFSTIGDRCTFGETACVSVGGKIGNGTTFKDNVQIEAGVDFGDMVVLPDLCSLFGVTAHGKSFLKMAPVEGGALYAFVGVNEKNELDVFIKTTGALRTLAEYAQFAQSLCCMVQLKDKARQGVEMLAASAYLRMRFAGVPSIE